MAATYTTEAIRNIAFVGQHGSGKTTLVEALLHEAGVIGAMGSVEKGDTVCDFMEEEKHHGHSLADAVVHCDYQDTHINIIDTPGAADFLGQTFTALPAVETVAVVIDAAAGIDSVTRRILDQAKAMKLCRMIVINKIDNPNADLPGLLHRLQDAFGGECLPVNLPAEKGTRVVDCFFNPEGESDFGPVSDAHTALIDQVVEVDEELMALYLEQGEELEAAQLHEPFEKALREGHLVPVCFTAARPHDNPEQPVGVKALLEVFVKLAPNPAEGNPRPFVRGNANEPELHPQPDADAHVLAHVFNVRVDPFVGKLSLFRLHQGTITRDTQLYIGDPRDGESKRPFKVGHLFKLQGKEHVEIERAVPGDIVAVAKVEVHRDAVLHDHHDEDRIHLAPMALPEPMQGLAITPKRRGDEQKIADALTKLAEEDPSFRVTRDPATKETVIQGLGDLHLRVVLEKLQTRYNVEVDTRPPKIAYRETITAKAEGHHRHKKQTGGAGQFGEVYLRVEPLERGAGFEFSNDVVGGTIPQQFMPAVEKGVRQAMEAGGLAGQPVQDVKVSVYDGKHHPVDSKEVAFVTAGKRAFLDAFHKARPVLLEPMVELEVSVPQNAMGDITGDLSGKRGRIMGTDIEGDQAIIRAVVPLAEVANYQSQLKSVTGGQGSYTMQMSHYEPVPAHVQQQIAAEYQPAAEED